jgi:hypothetical protein
MATKKHTKSKALKAKATRRAVKPSPEPWTTELEFDDGWEDKALMAWRNWAAIRAKLGSAFQPGPRKGETDKQWDRRVRRICNQDDDAGCQVLSAKTATLAGIAAKLHVALALSEGFEPACIEEMIRDILKGMRRHVPHDLREKITAGAS